LRALAENKEPKTDVIEEQSGNVNVVRFGVEAVQTLK
jgi:hypothetical protein